MMISLTLPESLAKQSQDIAKSMNISRAHFIRQALEHEINAHRLRQERKALVKAFKKMSTSQAYLGEADSWMDEANTGLPTTPNDWWKQ